MESWAADISGAVLDVGCGPGQWTRHLHDLGLEVTGLDPVDAFIEQARRDHPACTFRTGTAQNLEVADGSVGGVLAWYSLIHTDPSELPTVFASFARALTPGGRLAVGYFAGPTVEPFPHAITTAFRWPTHTLVEIITNAGFTVTHTEERQDPGIRPHGAILAVRT